MELRWRDQRSSWDEISGQSMGLLWVRYPWDMQEFWFVVASFISWVVASERRCDRGMVKMWPTAR